MNSQSFEEAFCSVFLLTSQPKNLKLLDVECALLTFLVIDTVAWFSAISPAARTQNITEQRTVVDLTKRLLRLLGLASI